MSFFCFVVFVCFAFCLYDTVWCFLLLGWFLCVITYSCYIHIFCLIVCLFSCFFVSLLSVSKCIFFRFHCLPAFLILYFPVPNIANNCRILPCSTSTKTNTLKPHNPTISQSKSAKKESTCVGSDSLGRPERSSSGSASWSSAAPRRSSSGTPLRWPATMALPVCSPVTRMGKGGAEKVHGQELPRNREKSFCKTWANLKVLAEL